MYQHTARKPKGYGVMTDEGRGYECDSLQCCHCGAHWRVEPGSGRVRGMCRNCMQVTCGAKKCDECMHFMKKIELYEEGKLDVLR